MSNFLSIATVTASLRRILLESVQEDFGVAVKINFLEPSPPEGVQGPRINIYLYQVTPNAAWRNSDLPTRNSEGAFLQRPRVALDLHYLLTFYGDDDLLEPQRLLGSAVRTLHTSPILLRKDIQKAKLDFDFLAKSDLEEEIELIKFTPILLSLEELSKVWSVFFQIPYRLSVAYQGTVVLIDSEEEIKAAPPVLDRNIYVVPFDPPVIEEVVSAEGIDKPITLDSTLIIRGRRLRGDVTLVRMGREEPSVPEEINDKEIGIKLSSLPPKQLRAGVRGVQVIHKMLMGTPPKEHLGVESNVGAFILVPTITDAKVVWQERSGDSLYSGVIDLHFKPVIGRPQRLVMILRKISDVEPSAYAFLAENRKDDIESIEIPFRGVKTGDYLVSMQVDGAESSSYGEKVSFP
jgi:hypothetical protein